jgi:hypothetical protein
MTLGSLKAAVALLRIREVLCSDLGSKTEQRDVTP